MISIRFSVLRLVLPAVALALAGGCVSKAKAKADAQKAFIAGQQESLRHMQELQSPTVTVIGPVNNPKVAWTQDLTLAQALVNAEYTGKFDPKEIILVRKGVGQRIDPKTLLNGQDIPLQAGDVIQVRQ